MQSSNRIINYVAIHTLFWIRLCAGSNRYIIFRCKWIKCICMYEIYLAWKVYLFLLLIGARYRQYFPVLMYSIAFIIYIYIVRHMTMTLLKTITILSNITLLKYFMWGCTSNKNPVVHEIFNLKVIIWCHNDLLGFSKYRAHAK